MPQDIEVVDFESPAVVLTPEELQALTVLVSSLMEQQKQGGANEVGLEGLLPERVVRNYLRRQILEPSQESDESLILNEGLAFIGSQVINCRTLLGFERIGKGGSASHLFLIDKGVAVYIIGRSGLLDLRVGRTSQLWRYVETILSDREPSNWRMTAWRSRGTTEGHTFSWSNDEDEKSTVTDHGDLQPTNLGEGTAGKGRLALDQLLEEIRPLVEWVA